MFFVRIVERLIKFARTHTRAHTKYSAGSLFGRLTVPGTTRALITITSI